MVPFGGWEMPLSYPGGTLAEHRACRESAVAFDVSHLGTVRVAGPQALETVNAVLTNDLGRIAPGRAQYTHLLDETDASVLDDIIVWWVGEDRLDVMPNASNTARVMGAVGGEDVTATRAIVAVQGPHARQRLQAVSPEGAEVPRFAVRRIDWRGTPLVVAGTGYTGEDGVEFAVPVDAAEAFWNAVLAAGVVPAGLGARDTLRLEAALPLHGHELGPGITPLQAGLGWVVAWNKGPFQGRDALEEERRRGPKRQLAGLAMHGRRPPREGCAVMMDGGPAGVVTSGNFSPMLGHGIALAFLSPEVEVGTGVEVDVRNRPLPASVTKLPFLAKKGS
jgi:aminomethyltransferase